MKVHLWNTESRKYDYESLLQRACTITIVLYVQLCNHQKKTVHLVYCVKMLAHWHQCMTTKCRKSSSACLQKADYTGVIM